MEYLSRVSGIARTRDVRLRFLPSYADLFFAALLASLFLQGPGWSRLLNDGDTGWHIRTGDYILSHMAVPYRDLFSFSRPDAEWFAWEWLTDVLFSVIHSQFGLAGIAVICGIAITATATLLTVEMSRSGANVYLALGLTILFTGAASLHFHARPHVFTMLFLALLSAALRADLERESRRIWLLVPLTVVWTNTHGGFLAGIAFLWLTTLGLAAEQCLTHRRSWRPVLRYTCIAAACAGGSLLNPYGWRLHLHILGYLRSGYISNLIQEFQSPSFRSESTFQFEVLLFAGIACCVPVLLRRRLATVFPVLYFAHASLGAARHIPLFAITAVPFIASELTEIWRDWIGRQPLDSVWRALDDVGRDACKGFGRVTPWVLVMMAAVLFLTPAGQWPADFSADHFPREMVRKHRELLANARVLSSDQWGDYLIYHYYPRVRVYIDGRSDFYGDQTGGDYLAMLEMQDRWRSVLDRGRFDAVLAPAGWPLAAGLQLVPDWELVDRDSRAALYVHKSRQKGSEFPENHPLLPALTDER